MNRFISIGLSIAVAPALFLAFGYIIGSERIIVVSMVAFFALALPAGGLLVLVGLLIAARKRMTQSLGFAWKPRAWQVGVAAAVGLVLYLSLGEDESLSMGMWQEAGSREPPLVEGDDPSIEEIATGTGRRVQAGDVVKIRVHLRAPRSPYEPGSEPRVSPTVWLWTGKEPEGRDFASVSSWGDLGSPRVRKALINRPVGAKLLFMPGKKWTDAIPLSGFAAMDAHTLQDDGTLDKPKMWAEMALADRRIWLDQSARGVEIEILQACQGRLLRRSAVMRQKGTIINMFDMSYGSDREGILRWSALETNCDKPAENVRFEVGPLYYVRWREASMLYNWSDSYRRIRPPREFPGEYMICSHQGGPLRCIERR